MILVVGEMPSRPTETPLAGLCGSRLAKLAGTSLDTFLRQGDRCNLIKEPCTWEASRARHAAEELLSKIPGYGAVVLCGRRVAAAFGWEAFPFLSSIWMYNAKLSAEFIILPHPSGRNRWWNSEENTARAANVMTRVWRANV